MKILTWLLGFLVISLYLVWVFSCSSRFWSRKKNWKPQSHVRSLIYRSGAIFYFALVLRIPHYLPCSQSLAITVESGDKARSHHPSLALLACLGCSRVPQSPLSLGKASGGGTLTRLSLRLLACHRHPTFEVRAPCSLRRQSPYNLHFPMVSGLGAILGFLNDCFVTLPVTALVTNVPVFPTLVKLILRIPFQK